LDISVLFICILIAAAVAGGIMMVIRSKLKSVRTERTACNYTRNGSFRTTQQSDNFLFNNINKVPRAQQNTASGNSGSSGGGRKRR